MKFKIASIILLAAANIANAQNVPAPRHLSEQLLTPVKPDESAGKELVWKRNVLLNIDVKHKANKPFDTPGDDRSLMNTLIAGVREGKIKAYKNDKMDSEIPSTALESWIRLATHREQGESEYRLSDYQVQEDSIHFRGEDKTEVRIVGIAPVVQQTNANGGIRSLVLFWVNYPDALSYLAASPVSTMPGFTWADILESSSFYGKVERQGKREGPTVDTRKADDKK